MLHLSCLLGVRTNIKRYLKLPLSCLLGMHTSFKRYLMHSFMQYAPLTFSFIYFACFEVLCSPFQQTYLTVSHPQHIVGSFTKPGMCTFLPNPVFNMAPITTVQRTRSHILVCNSQ